MRKFKAFTLLEVLMATALLSSVAVLVLSIDSRLLHHFAWLHFNDVAVSQLHNIKEMYAANHHVLSADLWRDWQSQNQILLPGSRQLYECSTGQCCFHLYQAKYSLLSCSASY